ncbi:MAG: MTAP family purine nucleoside phosphorylase [Coriobacteriia bacterium]
MSMVGIIGGTNADFDFEWADDVRVETPYGAVDVAVGRVAGGPEVRFIRRHGRGHALLSSAVNHRANVWALRELGCSAILGTTVCGVIDPEQPLGSALVFDDLHFPDNRLPDGAPCTFFSAPGQPGRGHYIFSRPFAGSMRSALLAAACDAGLPVRDGGTYAYALGPRFNTRSEIATMRAAGACAVSQTAGPEAVLAGELELPYALVGFGVDYANGVREEPTPVDVLDANIAASKPAFEAIARGAAGALASAGFEGFVYRFE